MVFGSSKIGGVVRSGGAALSGLGTRDTLSWSCVSIPSVPRGVAIPVPGDLMGNSSSSAKGIGALILPRIEDPVLVLRGASALHFEGALNLLILRWAWTC